MKSIVVAVFVLLLSGCDEEHVNIDHQKTFDWAVKFCAGEQNVRSFDIYSKHDSVMCDDGRYIDIPVK